MKKYISLDKFYTGISVTLSFPRFSSLRSRDGVALCGGEGVADRFLLTEHCVLFALWCQCSTFCRLFAVCSIPDKERRKNKISFSFSNKRWSRQLKTVVLSFLTVSQFQYFHCLDTCVECLLAIKPHCLSMLELTFLLQRRYMLHMLPLMVNAGF